MAGNISMKPFEEKANQFISKHKIPGVALALNQDSQRLYERGFGYRDIKKQLSVDYDTVFGIASMTKSFTAVAIMKLQEKGKLSVNDYVVKHLPDFHTPEREKTEQMTIHHLLTHTSSIPPMSTHNYTRKRSVDADPTAKNYGLDLVDYNGDPIDTYKEVLAFIANLDFQLLGSPGIPFSYSNEGYGLLGIIISRVSGQSYEQYVIDNILNPAQMNNSFFDLEEIDTRDNVTTLYASKNSGEEKEVYAAPLWWDAPAMRAGGYLKSTVNDILKYLDMFRTNGLVGEKRILSAESVKQMVYPHVETSKGVYYGYGFSVVPDYYGATLIEHGGGLKGVSSFMCIVPEKQLTGVVLTNLSGIPADELLLGALNVAQGKDFNDKFIKYEDFEMPLDEQEDFQGTYISGEGMNVTFAIHDDQLSIHSEGKYEPLRCIGQDLYLNKQDATIKFMKDQHNQVDRVFYNLRQIYKDKE